MNECEVLLAIFDIKSLATKAISSFLVFKSEIVEYGHFSLVKFLVENGLGINFIREAIDGIDYSEKREQV